MATKNQQPFFPHDANSRNRDNIIRLRMAHGPAGYGVYFMLLERLRNEEMFDCSLDYDVLAFDIDCDTELIRSVICDFGLFEITHDGTRFHSIELSEQMAHMLEEKRKRSEKGRAAAAARYGKEYVPSEETQGDESYSRLKREISDMRTDSLAIKNLQSDFAISEAELDDFFARYERYCQLNGLANGHKDLSAAWTHLRGYVRKIKSNATAAPSKRGKQSPVTERLSEAETEYLKDLDRKAEKQRSEAKRDRSQSPDNYYRNRGYEPSCTPMPNLFDPEWTAANPPTHPEWIGKFPGREKLEDVFVEETAEIPY